MRNTPSQIQLRGNYVQSNTVVTAPTEDLVARVFRAEVRRVVIPAIQQCFDTFKASPNHQLDEIRQEIEEMTQQLVSRFNGNEPSSKPNNVNPSHSSSPATDEAPSHIHQDSADLVNPCDDLEMTVSGVPNCRNQPKGQHFQKRSCSWTFCWRIGKLRVTISTTVTKRKISPDYRSSGCTSPKKACCVKIEFIPALTLVLRRGLHLSVENTRDQRGYYQICPFLSTFAIVPYDAEVWRFISENNVEGIQILFQKGFAAPNDRDEQGRTLLMVYILPYNHCKRRTDTYLDGCVRWCCRRLSPSSRRGFGPFASRHVSS